MAAPAQKTIAFAVGGRIARKDVPALCQRVCSLLETRRADVAVCDVSALQADAVAVEALARLQLAARRHRCRVRLRCASSELLELIALLGLGDVLTAELRVEPLRQAEQGEERLRRQEERELGDPAV